MLAASHALTGAIIAAQVSSPEIGYAAALISHPLLDLCPHWDLNTRHKDQTRWNIIWTSLLDAAIGFGLGFVLFADQVDWRILLVTMFIAQLPDWLEAPLHIFKWKFFPFGTIKRLQHYWHTKLDLPWGALPQLAVLAGAVFLGLR